MFSLYWPYWLWPELKHRVGPRLASERWRACNVAPRTKIKLLSTGTTGCKIPDLSTLDVTDKRFVPVGMVVLPFPNMFLRLFQRVRKWWLMVVRLFSLVELYMLNSFTWMGTIPHLKVTLNLFYLTWPIHHIFDLNTNAYMWAFK